MDEEMEREFKELEGLEKLCCHLCGLIKARVYNSLDHDVACFSYYACIKEYIRNLVEEKLKFVEANEDEFMRWVLNECVVRQWKAENRVVKEESDNTSIIETVVNECTVLQLKTENRGVREESDNTSIIETVVKVNELITALIEVKESRQSGFLSFGNAFMKKKVLINNCIRNLPHVEGYVLEQNREYIEDWLREIVDKELFNRSRGTAESIGWATSFSCSLSPERVVWFVFDNSSI
jgi:hypothetical protein